MSLRIHHKFQIPSSHALQRLDQVIAELLPQYSRARLQQWIRQGDITVDGKSVKPREKVMGGEKVAVFVEQDDETDQAEDIPLDVVFEDSQLIVVNKPPGLVVHPGAGNPKGTLLNALLNHDAGLANIPRAGIVHRLDKETSGLMVIARTLESQNFLVGEIQERKVTRVYEALVYGVVSPVQGTIEGAIGRHPVQRKKMAMVKSGKPARTHYRLLEQLEEHAHVECKLDTGRTHQIRVHMQSIGYPLIGDATYGGTYRRPRSGDDWQADALKSFHRQALHARKLALSHPGNGRTMTWTAPPPPDFDELHELLRG